MSHSLERKPVGASVRASLRAREQERRPAPGPRARSIPARSRSAGHRDCSGPGTSRLGARAACRTGRRLPLVLLKVRSWRPTTKGAFIQRLRPHEPTARRLGRAGVDEKRRRALGADGTTVPDGRTGERRRAIRRGADREALAVLTDEQEPHEGGRHRVNYLAGPPGGLVRRGHGGKSVSRLPWLTDDPRIHRGGAPSPEDRRRVPKLSGASADSSSDREDLISLL